MTNAQKAQRIAETLLENYIVKEQVYDDFEQVTEPVLATFLESVLLTLDEKP